MSDLEAQIRNLTLRSPGESLDEQVFSSLNASSSASLVSEDLRSVGDVAKEPFSSEDRSGYGSSETQFRADAANGTARPLQARRRGVVATSGWIVASVSLLVGAVAGNALPSFVQRSLDQKIELVPGAVEHHVTEKETQASAGPGKASVAFTGHFFSSESSPVGSQIVESVWVSPATAAVAWERETGQIFRVANHVSDRRFDMCRDCHRVGG